ncbi:hypothetical protein E2C01_080836 [Portunus trituberculatus]|uniref:Uncharacterized protein n=1 Tax=Portunus trituberculatus TaxID=210409 RepID=A0A5B7J0N2_PORTR|nr:hypothetical protein [Portunus trituberculatus]
MANTKERCQTKAAILKEISQITPLGVITLGLRIPGLENRAAVCDAPALGFSPPARWLAGSFQLAR